MKENSSYWDTQTGIKAGFRPSEYCQTWVSPSSLFL